MNPNDSRHGQTTIYSNEPPQADPGFMSYWKAVIAYLVASVIASRYFISWYAPETGHPIFGMVLSVGVLLILGSALIFLYAVCQLPKKPTR